MPKLAILFWFYKNPLICKNRLVILRKYNPGLKIYGLYGGDLKEAERYKKNLNKYLDDFYISPFKNPKWKWINGDLMLLDWFKKRGKNLSWESLAVVQWDILILAKITHLFQGIKRGQLYLSGLRKLNKKLESRWMWTKPRGIHRRNYINFKRHIKNLYGFRQDLSCCLFIFPLLPRIFFKKYNSIENSKIGFIEYKIPTYAKIFKIPMFRKDIGVHWFIEKLPKNSFPLNADSNEISKAFVESELERENGFRMFHPFSKIWKNF